MTEIFDHATLPQIDTAAFCRRIIDNADKPLAIIKAERDARNGSASQTLLKDGWLIEPVQTPRAALWIFGAGHVGRALTDTLAPLPDFEITWIDTAADRFPDHVPLGVETIPASNPALLVAHAPPDAHHLILTYSHALDLNLCHALLGQGFVSAGLIGSKTKWARFRKRLRQLGHTDAQISRINCPIGDPSMGKHPQAIAVGVASALLCSLRRQTLGEGIAL